MLAFSSVAAAKLSTHDLLTIVKKRDPAQKEFFQAVEEVVSSVTPVLESDPKYVKVMERLIEPERAIQFRVPWLDDKGQIQINRGFRVQYNSAIGPYKGGIRFHPSVNMSIIKFLGFEQTFKNSLTSLPMGGGKGGSDWDPKGKTDAEVMRFTQSFMTELCKYIGADTDVPAGDIGVGGREIGYMFGQYKRIRNEFTGVLTGKGFSYGGSLIRPEATGYGTVWYTVEMLKHIAKEELKGKRVLISGSGNVAQYAAEKCLEYGATPITFSDSNGTIYEPKGFTKEKIAQVMNLKNVKRGRCKDYVKMSKTAQYFEGKRPWGVAKAEIALPCATQNEIEIKDAKDLKKNGVYLVAEGANMPSTSEAVSFYHENNIMYGPAKAANCGGVACSGLEMSQNSGRRAWTREQVSDALHLIMKNCFKTCFDTAEKYGKPANLQMGANLGGFLKVADAMLAQGCV